MSRLLTTALFLGAFVAGIFGGATANAQAQPSLSRAQVEAIVSEYIEKNGDKLIGSIAAYQQRLQLAASSRAIRSDNPTQGPANAPVTIIEFVDFECPFCARVQPTTAELKKRYGNRVRWVAKHLPLSFHQKALPAAYAAQAAAMQGKYWEFSDKLWQRQEFLGDALYVELAKSLKLDLKKFNADRASAKVKAIVTADLADAEKVGARGTPFFLINGSPISGAMPAEAFTQVIEAALSGKALPTAPAQ